VLSPGTDQFNGLHEALVARLRDIFKRGTDVHFAAMADTPEDYATVETIAWAAREAGLGAHYTDLEQIGLSTEGQFVDAESRVIGSLFKLYPWEDLLRDPFAENLATAQCRFIEPPWKALVSNKAILPVLWDMFEGHPNLLPAFFLDDVRNALAGGAGPAAFDRARDLLARGHVIKPVFSREGASIRIIEDGVETEASLLRDYDEHPKVVQAYQPLPVLDGMRPVIGAWIVGTACVGMGLREDAGRITQDLSRFKPHYIED
jgi:glutathionylspermidine synthase